MHRSAASILVRQSRSAGLNASRQSSTRLATKANVRFASSSSSSSSSSTSSTLIPYAAGAAALGLVGYVMSSRGVSDATRRKNYAERMRDEERKRKEAKAEAEEKSESSEKHSEESEEEGQGDGASVSPATHDLADQASQESAFDPETNTINWDCPCLGGMADGPCGEEFKKAFSCFVFSEQEPKGIDCVEHFKAMQDCFRKYPEHYKEELEDEEELQRQDAAEAKEESNNVSTDSQDGEQEDGGVQEWRREMSKE